MVETSFSIYIFTYVQMEKISARRLAMYTLFSYVNTKGSANMLRSALETSNSALVLYLFIRYCKYYVIGLSYIVTRVSVIFTGYLVCTLELVKLDF